MKKKTEHKGGSAQKRSEEHSDKRKRKNPRCHADTLYSEHTVSQSKGRYKRNLKNTRDHSGTIVSKNNSLLRTKGKNGGLEIIYGRNPVLEALKSGQRIDYIMIQRGSKGQIEEIRRLAVSAGVRCEDAEKSELDRITGGNHQGVAAFVPPYRYSNIDEILGLAERKGEPPFVIILNNIEDPQNLGAVMRSAEGAGAHGIIIAKDRSSGVTQSAIRVSAGAAEYVKCARVANISAAIEKLKKSGLWIYACDMGGEPYWDHDLTGGAGIVIGNEGKGISRLVREKCDFTLSVPMCGRIQSLNAANAATVIMYEARRQRSR